jgi:hypothetical protein
MGRDHPQLLRRLRELAPPLVLESGVWLVSGQVNFQFQRRMNVHSGCAEHWGESLTRSLCSLLRKMLSEVTLGPQQLNREAHPHLPFGALWYTGNKAGNVIETHEQAGVF